MRKLQWLPRYVAGLRQLVWLNMSARRRKTDTAKAIRQTKNGCQMQDYGKKIHRERRMDGYGEEAE